MQFFLFPPSVSTYTPPDVVRKGRASAFRRQLVAALRSQSSTGRRRGEAQVFIRDLLKNQVTVSAEVHQTVLEVAEMMVNRNIGAVPVLKDGQLVGIFTERDLMKRVIVGGKDPALTPVRDVMTEGPLTIEPKDSLETCMALMRRHGFRHLLVREGPDLKGVVSLRDLLLHDLDEKDDEVRMMRAYLHSAPDAG
jgi:CBS domain-containing protein